MNAKQETHPNQAIMNRKIKRIYVNLLVLMKGNPDVDFIHGLPEKEGAKCHPKECSHFHHLH